MGTGAIPQGLGDPQPAKMALLIQTRISFCDTHTSVSVSSQKNVTDSAKKLWPGELHCHLSEERQH